MPKELTTIGVPFCRVKFVFGTLYVFVQIRLRNVTGGYLRKVSETKCNYIYYFTLKVDNMNKEMKYFILKLLLYVYILVLQ